MVMLEFTDLADGESLPSDCTVSAVELVREHRHRWVYHTSKGDIVFRRLPLRMHRVIQEARLEAKPKTRELLDELDSLRPFMDGLPIEEIDEQTKTRAAEIVRLLQLSDISALGVIVVPTLECIEDYDDLLSVLTPEEQIIVQKTVSEMATITPSRMVDSTPLEIAEKLGIEVVPEDTVYFLTVSQSEYFVEKINAERKAIERLQHQMGGRR